MSLDITDVAMALGALPLLTLLVLLAGGWKRVSGWWFIATGFGVSFLADAATMAVGWHLQWVPVALYPASQAALIGGALLETRQAAVRFNVCLVAVGVLVCFLQPSGQADAILTPLAWGSVAVLAWQLWYEPGLRLSLLVYFGLGALAWLAFCLWPADPLHRPWYAVQSTRLVGIALFCRAAWRASPHLRLVRSNDL